MHKRQLVIYIEHVSCIVLGTQWCTIMSTAIYIRLPRELLEKFDEVVQRHGLSRSEAVREAMKLYIKYLEAPSIENIKAIARDSRIRIDELERYYV